MRRRRPRGRTWRYEVQQLFADPGGGVIRAGHAQGCDKAPKYKQPSVAVPPAYKENLPVSFKETDDWKLAHPKDDTIRGKWWELFNDPQLNALEEQVNISNQNIAQADAAFRAARAVVKQTRSEYFPTVTTSPSITVARVPSLNSINSPITQSNNCGWAGHPVVCASVRCNLGARPVGAGALHRGRQRLGAQATAADLENVRLSVDGIGF
jgi:outer membrane protein TolC